jgi:LuxR family maltose regulon positive regulatory protein
MKQSHLLATKTFLPPIPKYQVRRLRLEQRLDAALRNHHKLILVSALAGSGKSSLVAAWASQLQGHTAWVSLEPTDDDPLRFWSYFLAALRLRHPEVMHEWLEELDTASALPLTLLSDLINLLSSRGEPLVLVLDDYHTIENTEIHQGVTYLLEHIPAQVCLVITTRIDPPLPIHRWRARSQLTEIREADLRFTLEEAGDFLIRQMGLNLEQLDIQRLEERTEGWATGLQLAALALQSRLSGQGGGDYREFIEQFSGSHQFVLDYLLNEVLAWQSQEIQRFLLGTSILESFCAPLCEWVLQDDGLETHAEDTLEALERANLFLIPLDETHTWFRYHHLFASFLGQRLRRQGASALHRLNQRAAEWYDAHGRVDEALEHALAAENIPFACEIVRRHAMPAANQGLARAVAGWLERLPEAQLAEDGKLSLLYAWMLLSIGKTNSLEPHIHNASRVLHANDTAIPDPAERQLLLGQLAALQATLTARKGDLIATERLVEETRRYASSENTQALGLAWLAKANLLREVGEFTQAISAYQQALPLMPATGVLYGIWIMVIYLGQAYLVQGQLQAAEKLYRSSMDQAAELKQDRAPAIGILQVELARVEYERNRLAEARVLFAEAEANSQHSGLVELMVSTALLGARLDRLDGNLAGAIRRLEEKLQAIRRFGSPYLSAEVNAWLAYLQAEAGSQAESGAWAREIYPRLGHNPGDAHGLELFCLVRVLILQGGLEEALELVRRLGELAEKDGNLGRVIESRMLQAEILWMQGKHAESLEPLETSLELAENAGFIRLFLDEGSRLSPALVGWHASGRKGEFASMLLGWFRQEAGNVVTGGKAAQGEHGYPVEEIPDLTRREREVLQLLVRGLSYPKIAEQLVISPGTVKTHVSHIYSKLGVEGRMQVIRHLKELKIE